MAVGVLLERVVSHRVHQVGLAQAHAAVEEERVVSLAGRVGHRRAGRHRELVRGSHHERVEAVLRVDLQLTRGRGLARRRLRHRCTRRLEGVLLAAGAVADDELHAALLPVLRLEVLQEHVEQVVPYPVDHELARVGEGELVALQADRLDRLEVGLEGVAREPPAEPIDGSGPEIGCGAFGIHRHVGRRALRAVHRLVHSCGQGTNHRKYPIEITQEKRSPTSALRGSVAVGSLRWIVRRETGW